MLRALASVTADIGDTERQHRCFLRLLAHDQYDEIAHLGLIRLLTVDGRLGEARRCHAHYAKQMAELGCRALSYPEITRRVGGNALATTVG